MLCISVTPESRTLAKVDLFNASKQCDLIELCLDRLMKVPDIPELLEGLSKPVLISCRREQDGGRWQGSEDERLLLLQRALEARPAYVELELDIAYRFPKSPSTQRVISYTSLKKPLTQVDGLFEQAVQAGADIVKFTWPTRTLNEAWPLLSAITKKRDLPVVGVGLGHAGRTFALLAQKYAVPWVYASLERGMEAYEEQPSVSELEEFYRVREIGPQTRFVGIVGFGASRALIVRVFNDAFQRLNLNTRCLPLEIGTFEKLPQMLEILQINAILTSRNLGEHILPLAEKTEESAEIGRSADLLLRKSDGWHAYNLLWRSALKTLERTLRRMEGDTRPLKDRAALVIGSGRVAQSVIYGLQQLRGQLSVTSSNDDPEEVAFCPACGNGVELRPSLTRQLLDSMHVRYVPFSELSEEPAEVLIIADPSLEMGYAENQFHPSLLRPPLTIMDLTRLPEESDIIDEARRRGCNVVRPVYIFGEQIAAQFKSITGQDLPDECFQNAIESVW